MRIIRMKIKLMNNHEMMKTILPKIKNNII